MPSPRTEQLLAKSGTLTDGQLFFQAAASAARFARAVEYDRRVIEAMRLAERMRPNAFEMQAIEFQRTLAEHRRLLGQRGLFT
jgi:hypothetical protein